MPVTPFIKTPFTDLTGCLFTLQEGGSCDDLELRMINCFEAYGVDRAKKVCANIIDDFKECLVGHKQRMRVYEMRTERRRQISKGLKSKNNRYMSGPRLDSFQ